MIDAQVRLALLRSLADVPSGSRIAVGMSGGADSTALLRAAVHVGAERDIQIDALVVDHGLQSDSARVAERAAALATQLGATRVIVAVVTVNVSGQGIEAAARDARRAAFQQHARKCQWQAVLLGHTLDDQAETVLLGLARGAGARSLAGMRAVDGLYRRPLLELRREHVRRTVSDLDTVEDPHNADPRFARVRVRADVLPVLENQLGPGMAAALARSASMLRDDADFLDELASTSVTDDVHQLAALAPALRTRVIRMQALAAGCPATDLTRDHVLAVEALVSAWHGQGPINLPGGVDCRRADGKLCFTTRGEEN